MRAIYYPQIMLFHWRMNVLEAQNRLVSPLLRVCILGCARVSVAGARASQNCMCFHRNPASVWVMFGCVGSQLSAECGLILKYTWQATCFIEDVHRGQFSAALPLGFPAVVFQGCSELERHTCVLLLVCLVDSFIYTTAGN